MSPWELATIVAKFMGLCAMAGIIGGGFMLAFLQPAAEQSIRNQVVSYILLSAIAGVLATSIFFLVQIGAINDAGLSGMWDVPMIRIFAASGLGKATGLRLLGYFIALTMAGVLKAGQKNHSARRDRIWTMACLGIYSLLLSYSFHLTGHVALLGLPARAAIVLHVIAVFVWIGALFPLRLYCSMHHPRELQELMTGFGRIAAFILAALFVSGLYVAAQLVGSLNLLVSTLYGRLLLLKLTGVLGLLAIAALNKFFLVPGLRDARYAIFLKRSISVEMAVALAILGVTSYFTTAVELAQ